jgi:hypothetical protein
MFHEIMDFYWHIINRLKSDIELKTRVQKMTDFWDIAPSSLVEVDRRFRGTYCLHRQCDEVLQFKTRIFSI